MNIEGVLGLFPLTKLNARYIGYYISTNGTVFSTKKYKKPTVMAGSVGANGHYYTFAIGRNQSKIEYATSLLSKAQAHTDWKKETLHLPSMTVAHDEPSIARPPLKVGIESKGYIIGQVQGEALVFGSKPKVHLTLDSVKTEVARLAAKSPGTQIIYLQIQGGAVINGIHWL